jgi:RNA polymerase sigma-70 factor (ECF subfamily)
MSAYATYTDARLVQLLVEDDKQAFDVLYKRHWEDLYNTAYRRLKNIQQTEDIVQEIFLQLWKRRCELSIGNVPAYLHTAVRFKVLNYIQRGVATEALLTPFEAIVQTGGSADRLLREKELFRLLELYIETLPPKRKQIFLLYLTENLPTKEIAERLGISQKNVQNQLGIAVDGFRSHVTALLLALLLHHH